MAYHLQSLITILQQILNPEQEHWILDDHNKPQLESLLEKAASLKQIHENSSVAKLESLESQIRDAAHKAEDLIESHMDLPSTSEVVDLTHLHKLQTLTCMSELNENGCRFLLHTLRFPSSLRKLTLYRCVILGRVITSLCALPNLEVLKIIGCVFDEDEEWEAAEGDEFRSLQFLQFEELNLVRWGADETNFPRLRHLVIGYCPELEEIPSSIGDIPTLQLILLQKCSPSVVSSAKQIHELQQSEFDNYDLRVELYDD